jgi:putative ABC transport system permease protein
MRLYEALLHLYPASFRGEYGAEMCAIFAQRRRDTSGAAVIALWVDVIWEIVFNSIAAHSDVLRQDVRYTARALARTPGFAITAILVAALGIGANTAAFTVTDFVLIRPLPFPQPERLVALWERLPGYTEMELSPATYRDWKTMNGSFEAMGGYTNFPVNLVGQGEPERIYSALVTANLFSTLGTQPAIGRGFTAADEHKGAPGTVLLGYGLWKAQFGGDSSVLGRKLILDDAAYVVIGVMPRDFHFPNREVEIWTPFQFGAGDFEDRNNNYVNCVARLKNGVSVEQARAEMSVIATRLERQYPKENAKHGATVNRLRDELSNQSRLLLIALCGAAGCVLLIACANMANLLLARGLVRQKELAVRTALGAGRERLVRQLITESLVLAIPGGALGVLLAVTAVPLLARLVPNSLPVAQTPSVDWRMLIFAGVLTSVTGVAFGVFPALRASRNPDLSGLREGSRAGGGRKERIRSMLVIAELVASVVLLVSSGLLMRALWKVQATDPGFRADGVLTLRTALPMPKYEKAVVREAFYTRVLSEIRQLPGVSRAAYISFLPMVMGGGIFPVSTNGELLSRDESQTASMRFVTPGFFSVLSIPLRLGRDVSESDTINTPFVAVVSQSFVRRYWPNASPLGRHFYFAAHDRMVVGVVGDVRVRGLERISEPQVYLPHNQLLDDTFDVYAPKDLVVRSDAPPATLVPAIRHIIQSADRQQPISDVRTMGDIVETQTASRSIQLRVLGAFAALALLLAGIGIHGLLSFTVSQRSQEIGVRLALGACPRDILLMVLRQGAGLAVIGVALGAVLAYVAGRAMQGLLAGVTPADTPTFLAVIGLTLAMTLIGSLLPALRATRVDPITAIRME